MNVLKCEFIKLGKSLAFKVTLAVVCMGSMIYGLTVANAEVNYNSPYFDGLNLLIAFLEDNMFYVIVDSIIAALFICNDFENRTIQESITCGNSHLSIVAAKVFVYTVSIMAVSLPYSLISAAFVAAKSGWGLETCGASGDEQIGKMLLAGLTIFFSYLPMIMFFVFTSFLVRKIGVSFAINIPVMLVASNLISSFMHSFANDFKLLKTIYDYSLLGINYKPFEYMNIFNENVLANVNIQNYLPIIIAGIVWSALMFAATVVVFKNRDLK